MKDYWHNPCPQCGRPKLLTSQLCRACKTGKDIAFAPGRERNKTDLPSPDWPRVARDFLVQFTGIFMSEGCVNARLSRDKTLSFSLTIKLRIDDPGLPGGDPGRAGRLCGRRAPG